jgi:hypothetical protein
MILTFFLQVCLEIWAWPGEPINAPVQEGEVAEHQGGQQLEQPKARRLTWISGKTGFRLK